MATRSWQSQTLSQAIRTRSGTDPDRPQFSAHRQVEQRRDELELSMSAVTIGMTVPCGPACALGPVPWLLLDAWLIPQ
jgi:hypothetical protein